MTSFFGSRVPILLEGVCGKVPASLPGIFLGCKVINSLSRPLIRRQAPELFEHRGSSLGEFRSRGYHEQGFRDVRPCINAVYYKAVY